MNKLFLQIKDIPNYGTDLGGGFHKIRLAVKSKSKGKSGGLKVISHVEIIIQSDKTKVELVYLYDKSETGSVDLKKLRDNLK